MPRQGSVNTAAIWRTRGRAPVTRIRSIFLVLIAFVLVTLIVSRAPASLLSSTLHKNVSSLSFTSAVGTIWRGELKGVVVGTVDVGRVEYTLAPLSLLTLSPHFDIRLSGGVAIGKAQVIASQRQITVRDGDLRVQLDGITQVRTLGVPVTGFVDVSIATLALRRDGCREGDLTVSTDFLTEPARRWGAEGFIMSGPGACENGGLFVDLSGEGRDGDAKLALTMRPDFSFAVDVAVDPGNDRVETALKLIGFEDGGQSLTYRTSGVLRNLAL